MICPVSSNGVAAVKWVQTVFHECAYNNQDVIAIVLGYISISFWIFAQFPQLVKNAYSRNSKSLSLLFLANWLSGDFANLVGCILTDQMPFQTYLAIYFVFIDTSLLAQSVYFQQMQNNDIEEEIVVEEHEETPLLVDNHTNLGMLSASFYFLFSFATSSPILWDDFSIITISSENDPALSNSYFMGRIFAWICTVLYLSSRMPQIYWNFKRQSCQGLAMVMFFFALMGNLFTTAAILVKSTSATHIANSLPYILGSGGTVIFDLIIFGQWLYYGEKDSINL